jgi:hypothetical protein
MIVFIYSSSRYIKRHGMAWQKCALSYLLGVLTRKRPLILVITEPTEGEREHVVPLRGNASPLLSAPPMFVPPEPVLVW